MSICAKFSHSQKVAASIIVAVFGITTDLRLLQPLKQFPPSSTVEGKSIDTRLEHPAKADNPIFVTPQEYLYMKVHYNY